MSNSFLTRLLATDAGHGALALRVPVGIIFICGSGPLNALMMLGPKSSPGKILIISAPAFMPSTASLTVIAPGMQGTP